jgi:transcription elongation factor GreA
MRDRTVYLTREGFERLDAEYRRMTAVRRPEVAERIRLSIEFASAIDNAEYDDAKVEQAFVEGRIRELERILANATIIDDLPRADFVKLGSRVSVRSTDGETDTYVIVGSAEADPRKGFISNESPVGRALLGKRAGDRISVVAPSGSFQVELVALE